MDHDELKSLFDILSNPPTDADKIWYQKRGYKFEKLLNALLEGEGLAPHASYKPKGEQIDGSFLCDQRVFLLEAKWQDKPAPASTIYQFKGKVEGKLVGTLGIFISMAGYTSECVDSLVLGKSLNVLLLDGDDIALAVSKRGAFSNLLRLRIREAAEAGSVYRSTLAEDLQTGPYISFTVQENMPVSEDTQNLQQTGQIAILCEGRFDAFVLNDLVFRILKENDLEAKTKVVHAGGKQNLPRVANLFAPTAKSTTVIVVADSDGDTEGTQRLIREGIFYDHFYLVTPSPSIES